MSDLGDSFREWRKSRSEIRAYWHECPACAAAYGTGTKVAPGGKCLRCGWLAPGNHGEDARGARDLARRAQAAVARAKGARRSHYDPELDLPYVCQCGKMFHGVDAQHQHAEAKGHALVQRGEDGDFLP